MLGTTLCRHSGISCTVLFDHKGLPFSCFIEYFSKNQRLYLHGKTSYVNLQRAICTFSHSFLGCLTNRTISCIHTLFSQRKALKRQDFLHFCKIFFLPEKTFSSTFIFPFVFQCTIPIPQIGCRLHLYTKILELRTKTGELVRPDIKDIHSNLHSYFLGSKDRQIRSAMKEFIRIVKESIENQKSLPPFGRQALRIV